MNVLHVELPQVHDVDTENGCVLCDFIHVLSHKVCEHVCHLYMVAIYILYIIWQTVVWQTVVWQQVQSLLSWLSMVEGVSSSSWCDK